MARNQVRSGTLVEAKIVPAISKSTGRALVEATRLDDAMMLPAAAGADEAVRPAPREHRFPAPILAPVELVETRLAEALLKLNTIVSRNCLDSARCLSIDQ